MVVVVVVTNALEWVLIAMVAVISVGQVSRVSRVKLHLGNNIYWEIIIIICLLRVS